MAAVVEKTGKTIEEALNSALAELKLTIDRVDYEVMVEPTKGFFGLGAKLAKIKVTVKKLTPIEVALEFLHKIFASMKLPVEIQQTEKEDHYIFNLKGNDLGILIGKHGQTLDALQYLTNLAANRELSEEKIRIIIDVEDYRKRREETLCRLAMRLADKVRRS